MIIIINIIFSIYLQEFPLGMSWKTFYALGFLVMKCTLGYWGLIYKISSLVFHFICNKHSKILTYKNVNLSSLQY